MRSLERLLELSSERHAHLCPRQVLGVRMGILAAKELRLELPQSDKRLFAFAETDGCLLSGIGASTGCWVERRTLRVEDYGKVAVTFVDTVTGKAIRIVPSTNARKKAPEFAPEATDRRQAMLLGYQRMPDELLLNVQRVQLQTDLTAIISRDGHRVQCEQCGEEIINEREVLRAGRMLCHSCAGSAYYRLEFALIAAPAPARTALHSAEWCFDTFLMGHMSHG